jgi:hypothetical protein
VVDTFTAVIDVLDDVLMGLPALDVYVQMFGASHVRLLEKPLVNLYVELMNFGVQAAKLFEQPVHREVFHFLHDGGKLNGFRRSLPIIKRGFGRCCGIGW